MTEAVTWVFCGAMVAIYLLWVTKGAPSGTVAKVARVSPKTPDSAGARSHRARTAAQGFDGDEAA